MYTEAEKILEWRLDAPSLVKAQVARYRTEGYPENNGLAETGITLRRHTDAAKRHGEAWWAEIAGGSRRDQLSFDYCCARSGVRYATFSPQDRALFTVRKHRLPRARW